MCSETRMATRIIAGTRDTETKKQLLAIGPFPSPFPSHITIGNVQANQRQKSSPSISLELLREDGAVAAIIENVIPDPGA